MSIIRRIEPDPLSRAVPFRITLIPRLFYRADNLREVAGHVRLFASRPGKGWAFYHYGPVQQVWNFGLFAIHHIGDLNSTTSPLWHITDKEGWHITWANLRFIKQHRGITIDFRLADLYNAKSGLRFRDIWRHRVIGKEPN